MSNRVHSVQALDALEGQRILQYETEDSSDNEMLVIILTTADGDEFKFYGGYDGYVHIDAKLNS